MSVAAHGNPGAAALALPVTSMERPLAHDAEHIPGEPTTLSSAMSSASRGLRRARRIGQLALLGITAVVGGVITYSIVTSAAGSSERRSDERIAEVRPSGTPMSKPSAPAIPIDALVAPVQTTTQAAPVDAVAATSIGSGSAETSAAMRGSGSGSAETRRAPTVLEPSDTADSRPVQPKTPGVAIDTSAIEKKKKAAVAPKGEAELAIRVEPWARVSIDGKEYGDTPVITRLAAGRHSVRLWNKDLSKSERLIVDLVPGAEPRRIDRDWRNDHDK